MFTGTPFPAINPLFEDYGYGSDDWIMGRKWLQVLCEASGSYFHEGQSILDYGCGSGRLLNYISGYLKDFSYIGLEPSDSGPWVGIERIQGDLSWGIRSIVKARELLGYDPRWEFGFIGSPLEELALSKCNLIVLGSIFTHLLYDEFDSIITKMMPSLERGAAVVFSCFLADSFSQQGPGAYGRPDCFNYAVYQTEQVYKYLQCRQLEIFNWGLFQARDGFPNDCHYILRITKR